MTYVTQFISNMATTHPLPFWGCLIALSLFLWEYFFYLICKHRKCALFGVKLGKKHGWSDTFIAKFMATIYVDLVLLSLFIIASIVEGVWRTKEILYSLGVLALLAAFLYMNHRFALKIQEVEMEK